MKNKAEAKGKPGMNILFIYNKPFRALSKMTGERISEKMADDILMIVNGHFWRSCLRAAGHAAAAPQKAPDRKRAVPAGF